MAANMSVIVVLLCGILIPVVTAGEDCEGYLKKSGLYVAKRDCGYFLHCCGTCENRYCCGNIQDTLSESEQDRCNSRRDEDNKMRFNIYTSDTMTISLSVIGVIIILIIIICCCVCPCCCLYNMCRKPRPVMTTTTHTTVVNTQYPQQPVQSYQGSPQYPAYQPVPAQHGYGGHPQAGYPAGQPMPTAPGYQAPPCQPGPPPPYQEIGPGYPPAIPVPYSQAAFSPGQPSYPLQPPSQPGYQAHAGAPPGQLDFLSPQPPYNPAFTDPQPPKSGY
ncbi:protein shisa-4 [Esox lucius]|uniref:Protein shisa-5 n=1 Tax=Esox lucius TaxID=8010 RepID=A0AAY5K5I8_ESOLU|nr:protein shisa-4 [Esox lucius]